MGGIRSDAKAGPKSVLGHDECVHFQSETFSARGENGPDIAFPGVVSPTEYFVFTPLLSGAAVGTNDFNSVIEPVRRYPEVVRACPSGALPCFAELTGPSAGLPPSICSFNQLSGEDH